MSLLSRGLGGVPSLAPRCMYYHSAQLMSKMGSVKKVTRGVKRSYRVLSLASQYPLGRALGECVTSG